MEQQSVIPDMWPEALSKGLAAVKILVGQLPKQVYTSEMDAYTIDWNKREFWFRYKEGSQVVQVSTGWIMVPFENVYGFAFNE